MVDVALDDLIAYIGADGNDDSVRDYVQTCLDESVTMLTDVTSNPFKEIPDDIWRRLVLEVGAEQYNRKDTVSGTSNFATYDGGSVPVMAPRDPLKKVLPILNRYVLPL